MIIYVNQDINCFSHDALQHCMFLKYLWTNVEFSNGCHPMTSYMSADGPKRTREINNCYVLILVDHLQLFEHILWKLSSIPIRYNRDMELNISTAIVWNLKRLLHNVEKYVSIFRISWSSNNLSDVRQWRYWNILTYDLWNTHCSII